MRNHDVAILDNLTEGHRRALDPRAKFIEGDLADREQNRRDAARFASRRSDAFRRQCARRRIDAQSVQIFSQ